jgi:hypothetical protein
LAQTRFGWQVGLNLAFDFRVLLLADRTWWPGRACILSTNRQNWISPSLPSDNLFTEIGNYKAKP